MLLRQNTVMRQNRRAAALRYCLQQGASENPCLTCLQGNFGGSHNKFIYNEPLITRREALLKAVPKYIKQGKAENVHNQIVHIRISYEQFYGFLCN